MQLSGRGYAGSILRVNLKLGQTKVEPLNEDLARLLLGGKGLASYLLYKIAPKGIDPLSPKNPLMFVTGPLTGTLAPSSGRFCVVTKSPATGTINDSHCGGFFGPELKYAGFDVVIVEEKSDEPVSLLIENGEAKLEPAERIWGMTTLETEATLKKNLGGDYRIASIGPCGERCSPVAGIFTDMRSAGRGGTGAVMGSKKLKAIAVKGSNPIKVYDQKRFDKMAWIAQRALRMNETTVRSLPEYGTANILMMINQTGALPTRNFQTGRFADAEKISGETLRDTLWVKDIACMGCTIKCSKIAVLEKNPYPGTKIDGPDYETLFSLGSNCGVGDVDAVAYANHLCDLYGMDTISTGCIIAFIMELYEKGVITKRELGGVEAEWGNPEALVALTESMGKGVGVGKLLQRGVKKISDQLPGSEPYAMHVKGLEVPGYEPRAAQGMGLGYAVSDRGACHLRAYTAGTELCGYGGGADPRTYDRGKVQLAVDREDEKAVVDSAVICFFTLFGMRLKEVYQMVEPCTGFNYGSVKELKRLGARVVSLSRMFNVREGFERSDDTLPRRFLETPLPEGPAKGEIVHLEPMVKTYYEVRGWDENGVPTSQTLKDLQIDEILK